MALSISSEGTKFSTVNADTLVQNAINAALLQEEVNETNSTVKTGKKRSSKIVFTNQAPILSGSKPVALIIEQLSQMGEPTPEQKFSMIAYMTALLEATIQLASNQSQVSTETNEVSNQMVNLSIAQAKKAAADLADYQEQQYEDAHRSFWEKVAHAFKSLGDLIKLCFMSQIEGVGIALGIITPAQAKDSLKKMGQDFLDEMGKAGTVFQDLLSVMMMIGGILTEQPELVVMGALMMTLAHTGVQSDIDNGLTSLAKDIGGNAGVQLFTKILFEVVVSVAETAGIGALEEVVGSVGNAVAKAATTISDALASLFAKVTESAEADVVEASDSAGSASASALASTDGTVASMTETATEENVEAMGESVTKKVAEKGAEIAKSASKAFIKKMIMMLGTTKFFSDLMKAAVDTAKAAGANISANQEQLAIEIGGALLGAAATIGSMGIDTGSESTLPSLWDKFGKKIGEAEIQFVNNVLKVFRSMISTLASVANIAEGVHQMEMADKLDEAAVAQGLFTLYNGLLDQLNGIIKGQTAASDAIFKTDSEVSDRMNAIFVAPWQA